MPDCALFIYLFIYSLYLPSIYNKEDSRYALGPKYAEILDTARF